MLEVCPKNDVKISSGGLSRKAHVGRVQIVGVWGCTLLRLHRRCIRLLGFVLHIRWDSLLRILIGDILLSRFLRFLLCLADALQMFPQLIQQRAFTCTCRQLLA